MEKEKQISYAPLFRLLNKRGLKTSYLYTEVGIGRSTVTMLKKESNTHVNTILKICQHFNCDLTDVMEIVEK